MLSLCATHLNGRNKVKKFHIFPRHCVLCAALAPTRKAAQKQPLTKLIFRNNSKEMAWHNDSNATANVITAVWTLLSLKSSRQLIAAQVQLVTGNDSTERHWKGVTVMNVDAGERNEPESNLWRTITFHRAPCKIMDHFWVGMFQNVYVFTLRTHRRCRNVSLGWTRRMSIPACVRMPEWLHLSFKFISLYLEVRRCQESELALSENYQLIRKSLCRNPED